MRLWKEKEIAEEWKEVEMGGKKVCVCEGRQMVKLCKQQAETTGGTVDGQQ